MHIGIEKHDNNHHAVTVLFILQKAKKLLCCDVHGREKHKQVWQLNSTLAGATDAAVMNLISTATLLAFAQNLCKESRTVRFKAAHSLAQTTA